MSRSRTALACSAGVTFGLVSAVLLAGPLDPPAGPVTGTHKTLSEVEPRIAINATNTPGDADSLFKITQPGSYYLTGNITGVVGKHGIEIAVPPNGPGVTIDLGGFEMAGVAGMGAFDGVNTAAAVINVTVRNGTIRNWGDEGVELGNASTAVDLGVSGCGGFGIVLGQNSSAMRCRLTSNTAGGIATGLDCIVQSCSAQSNGGIGGIGAFNGCAVLDCTAFFNTGNGISTGHTSTINRCSSVDNTLAGFSFGSGCTVSDCAASFNDSYGFAGLDGATVGNSTSASNFSLGFFLRDNAKVTACTARLNTGDGIAVSTGGAVTGCSAYENGGKGINTVVAAVVFDCTSYSNGGDGISVFTGCTVSACSVRNNAGNGIHTSGSSIIVGNICVQNGDNGDGAGIHAAFGDSRIEDNNCIDNDRGIEVVGFGNIIIRNACSSNTVNWVLAANNIYGPIIDRRSPASSAVNGDAAVGSLVSTDPHANFTY